MSSNEVLKCIFNFNLQSSLIEAEEQFKIVVEQSFSCLKRVKEYLSNRKVRVDFVLFAGFQFTKTS